MTADRPTSNAGLLVTLLTATLVLVARLRIPLAAGLPKSRERPAPLGTYVISHVVLLI